MRVDAVARGNRRMAAGKVVEILIDETRERLGPGRGGLTKRYQTECDEGGDGKAETHG